MYKKNRAKALIFKNTKTIEGESSAHAAISPWVTASHSNSEVKQGRVSAVPAWGTSWEGDMLHVFALLLHVFCSFRWLRSFSGHTSSNGNRDRIYFCTLTLTFMA